MKFIKAFAVVVLLMISVMVLMGVFVPEIDDVIELQVEKPIVHVYAGMMNTNDMPVWVDDLDRIERSSGILAMPGSTFQLYFTSTETESVYTLEVLDVVPMQTLRTLLENDMLEIETSMQFTANGLYTDMSVFVQIKGKSWLMRSMLPLLKSVIISEIETDFKNFKRLQEE